MAFTHVLVLTILLPLATGNIFTSSHKVRKMALQEDKILSKLKDHIDEQQEVLKSLSDTYMQLSQESELKHESEMIADLNHPNGVYLVIKRFALQYAKLLGDSLGTLRSLLATDSNPITLATNEDFDGALRALLRLQEVYNLTVSDMVIGNYRRHYGPSLEFDDAYYLGRIAFIDGKLYKSRDWLDVAIELRLKDPAVAKNPRQTPTVGAIKALIGRGLVLLRRIREAENVYMEARVDDPGNGDVITLQHDLTSRLSLVPPPITEAQANYSRLCQYRSPYHIETPNYSAMKCRYKAALVPYYVFREEILSISPYVSLFYKVVTEEDRQHLMKNVYDKLARGNVGSGIGTDKSTVSNIRTSDVGWLPDFDDPTTATLSRRIGLVTGLSMKQIPRHKHPTSAEDFQVVNYGLAGHYDIHLDPFHIPDGSGFRIATFLIYLNPVEEGGNTVFTKAGISVAPEKDTVLFWYSFPPSFDNTDDLTHHAGCPVMIGQKWIANKWIRSHGNAYHRPCGTKASQTQLDIEKTMVHHQREMLQI